MKKSIQYGLCAAAMLSVAGAALAAPAPDAVEVRAMTVKYSLTAAQTAQGARALYARLRSTAFEVCTGGFPRAHELWVPHRCAAAALEKAVEEVNLAAVDAVHNHRRGTIEVIASR